MEPFVAGPDWAAATSAVAAAVGTAILAVTAVFALRQLTDARRARHGAFLTDLSRWWDEPLTVEAQKLYADYGGAGILSLVHKVYEQGGATDEEVADLTTLFALPNLWETIAVLKAEGAVSLSVIDRMWGLTITKGWLEWQEPIGRLRGATDTPGTYSNFERLAAELEAFEREERLARRLAAILWARKGRPTRALGLRIHLRSLVRRLRK
jgi:hypothetical protein